MCFNELLNTIDKIHTTELGVERIRRNLKLDNEDIVEYCRDILKNKNMKLKKKVKIIMLNMRISHLP